MCASARAGRAPRDGSAAARDGPFGGGAHWIALAWVPRDATRRPFDEDAFDGSGRAATTRSRRRVLLGRVFPWTMHLPGMNAWRWKRRSAMGASCAILTASSTIVRSGPRLFSLAP